MNPRNLAGLALIQVETRKTDEQIEVIKIDKQNEINSLISLLKQTDFKTIENLNFDKTKVLNQWKIKIIFLSGQQDHYQSAWRYRTG